MNNRQEKSLKVNAFLNIIKQCCAIIFPMITFPYVSRVLGVEMYGKYNFASSIVSYFTLIAGLGVSSYAVREGAKIRDDKTKFEKFANEVFSINIFSTVLAYILLFLLLISWNKLNNYKILILISSINIFLITIGTDWINTVYEDFLYITIRYIVCQAMAVALIIIFVKDSQDIYWYALFTNFGITSANILNLFYIRKSMKIHIRFTFKMNFKSHFKPIMILFGNVITSTIYLYADISMLGAFVGDVAVGYYTVASKIYSLIKQMLNAVANVATPRFSHELGMGENNFNDKINKLLGTLIILVLPCMMGLLCVGKEIIILLSGESYVGAYSALAILSVSLVFSTVACIFVSVTMLAHGQDKEILCSSAASAALNIVLNFIFIPAYGFNAAAATTLLSEMLMMLMGMWYTRKYVKIQIGKELILGILGMLIVFTVCKVFRLFILNSFFYLLACVGISCLIYAMTLVVCLKFVNKIH